MLAQIDEWPSWNPAVRDAALEGPLEQGTTFRWAAGASVNASVLTVVDAPRSLAWRGRSMGIRHEQIWRIEARGEGCHVSTSQSLRGLLARVAAARLRQRAQTSLDTWIRLLKLEAEARVEDEDESSTGQTLLRLPLHRRGGTSPTDGPPGGAAS